MARPGPGWQNEAHVEKERALKLKGAFDQLLKELAPHATEQEEEVYWRFYKSGALGGASAMVEQVTRRLVKSAPGVMGGDEEPE